MIPSYFFDTANADAITDIFETMKETYQGYAGVSVRGVTTNPNAFSKIGVATKKDMFNAIRELDRVLQKIVTESRLFDVKEIHVELPTTFMSTAEANTFINDVCALTTSRIVIKVPPALRLINATYDKKVNLNVTGLSDAASILWALSHPSVKYASLIPGRMELVIDKEEVKNHMRFIASATIPPNKSVIAGSMRTTDDIKFSIQCNMVPTIGITAWDDFTQDDFKSFASWWNVETHHEYTPIFISKENHELTRKFFTDMDALGSPLMD